MGFIAFVGFNYNVYRVYGAHRVYGCRIDLIDSVGRGYSRPLVL